MSEYLVRWKFGPNSLINHQKVETSWYQQIHPDKKPAVDHYTSLLLNTTPAMACTTEIFQLVQLVPGQPEVSELVPEQIAEEQSENGFKGFTKYSGPEEIDTRNEKIMKMYNKGSTRRDIATKMNLSYQTVYSVTRRLSEE